jgi:hypothetical protein
MQHHAIDWCTQRAADRQERPQAAEDASLEKKEVRIKRPVF